MRKNWHFEEAHYMIVDIVLFCSQKPQTGPYVLYLLCQNQGSYFRFMCNSCVQVYANN